jgi:hypothetical protein
MCLSIPFRIYFKDISEILKDCFGLKDEKKNNHNREINMDLIEAQPILDDKLIKKQPVLEPNSDEELEKSYDFMDSD